MSLTTLHGLVGAVAAVRVVVADVVLGDALAVLTHELAAAARVVEHWAAAHTHTVNGLQSYSAV